jgi:hypothetical protein
MKITDEWQIDGTVQMAAVLAAIAFALSGCGPETRTPNECVANLFPTYDAKIMAQCVDESAIMGRQLVVRHRAP